MSEAIEKMVQAAKTFVERVERGEVRSKRTYAEFKEALDLFEKEPKPTELEVFRTALKRVENADREELIEMPFKYGGTDLQYNAFEFAFDKEGKLIGTTNDAW